MKKILSLVLVTIMLLAMATSVSAAGNSGTLTSTSSKDINVKGQFVDNSVKVEKIVVDISWDAMEFSYTRSGDYIWDADNHTYNDDNVTENWSATDNTVKVTNHSNVEVSVDITFSANTGYSVTGTIANNSYTLPSAEGKTTTDEGLTKISTLTLGGSLDSGTTALADVGTLTVTIAKKATTNP